jgi:hypothetical protein
LLCVGSELYSVDRFTLEPEAIPESYC